MNTKNSKEELDQKSSIKRAFSQISKEEEESSTKQIQQQEEEEEDESLSSKQQKLDSAIIKNGLYKKVYFYNFL